MDEDIEFDVAANDTASEVLRKLGHELQSLSETIGETSQKSQKLEVSMQGLGVVAAALAAAYGALKAASAVGSFIGASVNEFVAVEKAVYGLDESLVQLANTIESGTNIDEKSILSLMKDAKGKGFNGDQIGEVTKAAVGLAEVMQVSLTEALNRAQQATNGNFDAFERLIPGIGMMASQEEKLAAVTKLASEGLERKSDQANSAVAVFDRMNTELNNLYETVGALIEPFRQLAYEAIAIVAEYLTQALQPAVEYITKTFSSMADSVSGASEWLLQSIVGAFTAVEVAFTSAGDIANLTMATILLSLEQIRSNMEHVFLVVIPEYLSWFARNFFNIAKDAVQAVLTVFNNLGTSIGEIMFAIWNHISSGFSEESYEHLMKTIGEAGTRGLLSGFEPVTEALPEIGERAVSDFEKEMQGLADGSMQNIADNFTNTFEQRLNDIREGLETKPLDAKINLEPSMKPGSSMSAEVKSIQAVESRVMVRGSTEDPLLKVGNEQLNSLKRLEQLIERSQTDRPSLVGVI